MLIPKQYSKPTSCNWALLFLRLASAIMIMTVHGLPKLINFHRELGLIEDPFGMGAQPTLLMAIFAEVICPTFIALGILVRLSTLPIIFLLIVSLLIVHPEWSLMEGQFAWLLLIIFVTVLIGGSGRYGVGTLLMARWPVVRYL